jgi:hypothetical protein
MAPARRASERIDETVLSFEGGPRVDLRRELDPEERRALAALELGPSFAVLTAVEPGEDTGDVSADALEDRQRENVRRTLRFEELLAREGLAFRRVDSSAPEGSHRERCVAVALSRAEATQLAADHDQVPLFWWDGERFWLWPGAADERTEPPPAPGP